MWLGSDQRVRELQGRLPWLMALTAMVVLALLARLFYLQVPRHGFYEMLARENKIVYEALPGDRGMILDRWGRAVVDNRPAFSAYVLPDSFRAHKRDAEKQARIDETLSRLATILSLDREKLAGRVGEPVGRRRFQPLLVKRDLSWDELSRIEEVNLRAEGVFVRTEPVREYAYGAVAAHVLGYIHEVSPGELELLKKRHPRLDYHQGDLVGKQGVEARAESSLRGRDGFREQIVNAFGGEVDERVVRELGFVPDNREPVPGNNVALTLDWELQMSAEEALGGRRGAVVAMDPFTGEILALVSHPNFNPAPFARGITGEEYRQLLDAPGKPLYSKALQGQYPPGSTFKVFVAVAGLEEGIAGDDFAPVCQGRWRFGRRWYRCWKQRGHGEARLHKALRESCDVYFYKLGDALGIDRIARYATLFGFGRPSGIDLPNERGGLIPSKAWKERARGEPWHPGETLSCAIGQGYVLVTPLQLTRAIAAIANGGTLVRPYVISRAVDVDGRTVEDFAPHDRRVLPFEPEHLRLVQDGLVAVVNEPHGTGRAARLPKVLVAGKTGTAQVVRLEHTEKFEKDEDIPLEQRDHAWFTAYAPADDPRIAVTVLVEHGGHGGAAAAPVAREVIARFEQLRTERSSARLEGAPEGPSERRLAGRAAP